MRLGVNGWRLRGRLTGVGRYLLNLLRHWSGEERSRVFERIRLYTSTPLAAGAHQLGPGIEPAVLRPDLRMLLWENARLGPFVDDDVLFCPSYSRPLVARGRTVVTTHDATQKLHPELFPVSVRLFYNRLYGWSARHAALVVTDSDAARDDIVRCWGVPAEKIRVVYLAAAEAFHPLPDAAAAREERDRLVGSGDPFFLFVGKLSGRRSLPFLLEGFARFRRATGRSHRLVVVGLNPHNLDVEGEIERLGIRDRVRTTGYLSDAALNVLYNHATALVSPSVYETVSLPVMEAQAAGAPVVCIGTRGMREVTRGAAVFMERPRAEDLAEALATLAEDAELRERLAARGLESSRRFSWRRCAAETMAVLEEAAGAAS